MAVLKNSGRRTLYPSSISYRRQEMMWTWKWLQDYGLQPEGPSYVQKVLNSFRPGMKAHGEILGMPIIPGPEDCQFVQSLAGKARPPDDAPIIPIARCSRLRGLCCAYTPMMSY